MASGFIDKNNVQSNAGLCDLKAWAALDIISERPGFLGVFLCANIQALDGDNHQLGLAHEKNNKENKYKDSTHTIVFHSAVKEEECLVFDDTYIPQANPLGEIKPPNFYCIREYLTELEKMYEGNVVSWRISWKKDPRQHWVSRDCGFFIDV